MDQPDNIRSGPPVATGRTYRSGTCDVVLLAHAPGGFADIRTDDAGELDDVALAGLSGDLVGHGTLAAVAREADMRRDAIVGQLGAWNERRPLVVGFEQDGDVLQLQSTWRDYVTRRVWHDWWDNSDAGLRSRVRARAEAGQLTPLFGGTVGVHLTVVSEDGRHALLRRSSRARSWEGRISVPVMEGAHDGDVVGGGYNPWASATRGLREELGVAGGGLDVRFHSLWLELATYGLVLQGRVDLADTGMTGRMLKTSWQVAEDAWENDSIALVDDPLAWADDTYIPWSLFAFWLDQAWAHGGG